jgi:hypothetical protein
LKYSKGDIVPTGGDNIDEDGTSQRENESQNSIRDSIEKYINGGKTFEFFIFNRNSVF